MTATIITVDGPSGVGKGTLCQALTKHFGFHLLDSGAIYRILGLAVSQNQIDFSDEAAITQLAKSIQIHFIANENGVTTLLNQQDVSNIIRTQQVADYASKIAVFPDVRAALLQKQRDFAVEPGLVADGRDMGTVVFPQAQIKFFLDATAEERAKRRLKQLQEKGINGNFAQILSEIQERDYRDRNRAVAPLVPADDAILLDSSSLSINEVFSLALHHIRQRLPHLG
ncbi:cytidylate kinase [Gallibacterium genomosp. 3]|uniref:Cytidylate kinase n=1 Tax=Gallibacterium genomosp. 3 TaxID=505345 RepID=A0A1A7PPI5_9PAST|nr:(d)CMP kinase [Gallibacterium genomosp. 3]OBX03974.1 cytidylate kinase [Gallibacterium genomosp. 3]OBX09208.1 cytidylate kinase [Gallibacterium genomosp. 3]